jgi:hypothetical protein
MKEDLTWENLMNQDKVEAMYNEIKVLQEFSKKHFDMVPVTIKHLMMIKKEWVNYYSSTS